MATPIQKPTYEIRFRINKANGQRIPYSVMVREPPIINSYDDAVVHDSFKGDQAEHIWYGGVYQGLGYATPEISGSYYFRIQPGFGTIFGRQFEIDENYDIDMSALTGKKYCVVYVEINLVSVTKSFIAVKLAYAGAGYPDIETNNLIEKKQGIARMPLYRFIYKASGSSRFSDITSVHYTYTAGVAERARMMAGDGKWNGRVLSNLFYYNADRFKKGSHAVYADLAKALGPGKWIAASDQLEITDSTNTESGNRRLLKCTNDVILVDSSSVGTTKDRISNKVLGEGGTYKFFFTKGGNPIPENAQIVGVLVQGALKCYYWKGFQLFGNWDPRWEAVGGNVYFNMPNRRYSYTNYTAKYQPATGQNLFSPGFCYGLGNYIIGTGESQKSEVVGVSTGHYGNVICDPIASGGQVGNSVGYRSEVSFHGLRGSDPFIQVKIAGGLCVECSITFRFLYILGARKIVKDGTPHYDNWDTQHQYPWYTEGPTNDVNPFSSLSPQLEGGQT